MCRWGAATGHYHLHSVTPNGSPELETPYWWGSKTPSPRAPALGTGWTWSLLSERKQCPLCPRMPPGCQTVPTAGVSPFLPFPIEVLALFLLGHRGCLGVPRSSPALGREHTGAQSSPSCRCGWVKSQLLSVTCWTWAFQALGNQLRDLSHQALLKSASSALCVGFWGSCPKQGQRGHTLLLGLHSPAPPQMPPPYPLPIPEPSPPSGSPSQSPFPLLVPGPSPDLPHQRSPGNPHIATCLRLLWLRDKQASPLQSNPREGCLGL